MTLSTTGAATSTVTNSYAAEPSMVNRRGGSWAWGVLASRGVAGWLRVFHTSERRR